MRQKVRLHVLANLHPGDHVLELNAGTGADAAYFAGLGYRVCATDIAPGMLVEIENKIAGLGLADKMTVQQCSYDSLVKVQGGPFEYVFSNMGGLNCAADLARVARSIETILAPGGRVTCVIMPPVCLWELAQALRGDFRTAMRRLRPGGRLASVEGVQFTTWYYPPGQVSRAFGDGYRKLWLAGLSVFTPPADHKAFPNHHPRLYRWLRAMDDRLADRWPFQHWGDFYILTLEKIRL